jgi:small-conductance mechanosensitive channel
MEVVLANSKLSALQNGLLNALNACVLSAALLLPQQATAQQQLSTRSQEPNKSAPKQAPAEKAKPTPPREAKTPARRQEEKTPEKSPPEQTQQPSPTQPRESKDSSPTAPEKQTGEKEAQPPAAGAPTPAQTEKAKETPTEATAAAQPSPTAQPTPAAQPSPATEETPAQGRTTEKPSQEAPPQTAQEQAVSSAPAPSTPAGADQTQWSFRREIEALTQTFSYGKLILSLLFLLLGYIANKLVSLLVARAGDRRNVYAEWLRRVTPFVSFGLWLAVVLVIVQIFTRSLLAMVLLISIAALALAFALQPLLREFVGGLVILFERPFRLGDRITLGDHQGRVKKIGLRAFQLATSEGAIIAVPNTEALRQPLVNATPGTVESQVTIELPLPEDIYLEPAKRIAFESAIVSPYACIHKPVEVYVDEQRQNDLRARIVIQAFVFDARYERQLRSDTVERAMRGLQDLRSATSDPQGRLVELRGEEK